jgi:lipopolysaccharide export LptBFGC system permease protein LptF
LWSDASLKLGFGLWNNAIATYVLEAALMLGALWLYLKSTTASTASGKYGMGVFVVFLLLVNVMNIFGPLGSDSKVQLAVSALVAYFVFAAVAFWLDKKRN